MKIRGSTLYYIYFFLYLTAKLSHTLDLNQGVDLSFGLWYVHWLPVVVGCHLSGVCFDEMLGSSALIPHLL